MNTDASMVQRPNVLTNSAAEFVETKGHAIVAEAIGVERGDSIREPEFASEVDGFLPKDEVPNDIAYYEQSTKQMQIFNATLERFCKTLKEKKLDKKLDIVIKKPSEYKLEDVYEIASKIQERHESSEDTSACMRAIRKCFRATAKHKDTLNQLLSFVPTDSYGSIVCGGFTVILAVIGAHEKMRKDVQKALADIPRKMGNVRRLTDVHIKTPDLQREADSVFIAIFVVLERIVKRLAMDLGDRFKDKLKGNGNEIKEALETLDEDIRNFQEEVNHCTQLRMGRIEENSNWTVVAVKELLRRGKESGELQDEGLRKNLTAQEKHLLKPEEQTDHEKLQATVFDKMYHFFASTPLFNAVDGTVDREKLAEFAMTRLCSSDAAVTGSPNTSMESPADVNRRLANEWRGNLGKLDPDPSAHIEECLHSTGALSLKHQDQVQWMMNSEALFEWLSRDRSCYLQIEAETPPHDIVNSISFTTAMLTSSLRGSADFAVLPFFCALRTNDSIDTDMSGPTALLKSMVAQLLKFIVDKRDTIDLSFLADDRYARKAQDKPKYALEVFQMLLSSLPEKDSVFILIDSFSHLSGDEGTGEKIIGRIREIIASTPGVIVKMLITDPLPSSPVKNGADLELYLPDHIDGGREGINVELLRIANESAIQELRQRSGGSSSGGGNLNEDSDSDSDDW